MKAFSTLGVRYVYINFWNVTIEGSDASYRIQRIIHSSHLILHLSSPTHR